MDSAAASPSRDSSAAVSPPAPDALRLTVPAERAARERLRLAAAAYVDAQRLVPPLPLAELEAHARRLLCAHGEHDALAAYAGVLLHNALWRGPVARVPFRRRLLLLPQCLRRRGACSGVADGVGLLCGNCGACAISQLQAVAERLGYLVLVAEGTTVVSRLLAEGHIDAVIGVSCLAALERTFPHLMAEAVPGLAVPLCRDGCEETVVDADWVLDLLRLRTRRSRRCLPDIEQLRLRVDAWFSPAALAELLGGAGDVATAPALDWLGRGGKRWRPLLAAGVCRALARPGRRVPAGALRRVAVAVECFHKASLVHDDIEDDDRLRYGEPTLHEQHGVPIAINAGDLLIGEGYRLLAAVGGPASRRARMLAVAAEGHRTLCLGQGEELAWMRARAAAPLEPERVLRIFRRKTAPAFEVALRLGALCADASPAVHRVLERFSAALGTAYQIRDDLEDVLGNAATGPGDAAGRRPSLLLALAHERASAPDRQRLHQLWSRSADAGGGSTRAELQALLDQLGATQRARELFTHHRDAALAALAPLRHAPLKMLLFRLTRRILGA
jgi:geranylgeranyl pyrophosphate synthase